METKGVSYKVFMIGGAERFKKKFALRIASYRKYVASLHIFTFDLHSSSFCCFSTWEQKIRRCVAIYDDDDQYLQHA